MGMDLVTPLIGGQAGLAQWPTLSYLLRVGL